MCHVGIWVTEFNEIQNELCLWFSISVNCVSKNDTFLYQLLNKYKNASASVFDAKIFFQLLKLICQKKLFNHYVYI